MEEGTSLHVLIVDGDAVARAHLKRLLLASDVRCAVTEACDGRTALDHIASRAFDLVLLEVALPDLDGFAVVQAVGIDAMPLFAFATSCDTRAFDAFAVGAIGYLIKPVAPDRLAKVLQRVARWGRRTPTGLTEPQAKALRELLGATEGHPYVTRLAVRRRDRTLFVRTDDIDWIEASDTRVRVHTTSETYELRERLSALERLLSPREFARVQRGAIVRIDRIREIQPWFRGDYVIVLTTGRKITTGHSYRTVVRALLEHR